MLKSRDRTNPSDLPTLKTHPTPGQGDRFEFFFAKMRGKDELKGTRSNFIPWMWVFEHRDENCLSGCCNPRLGELWLNCERDVLISILLSLSI